MRKISLLFILLLIPLAFAQPNITDIRNISINASIVRISFNATAASNATVFYGTAANNLNLNETNSSYLTKHNISLTGLSQNTTYFFRINISTALNLKNSTVIRNFTTRINDLKEPVWSNNFSYQSSPKIFENQSVFNITWQDYNITNAWIEHNFSGSRENYSMTGNQSIKYYYYFNITPGNYRYRFFANDSSGNLNYTTYFHYQVNRANSSLNLTINGQEGNITLERGVSIILNATSLFGDSTVYLYSNGTLINQSQNPIENITLEDIGIYNITAVYIQSENYTYSSKTYFILVNDTLPPVFDFDSPINDTFYDDDLLIDFETDEEATCYYNLTGNYTLIDTDTWHVELLELNDSTYNITFRCTDGFNHTSYARVTNFTIDTAYPEIAIISPIYNIYRQFRLQFNYSINDTNLDNIWYNLNYNITKVYLNASKQNITFVWPGKNIVSIFANDSAGNYNQSNVTLYINRSINATAWSKKFNSTILARSVSVLNKSFNITGNISVDKNLTILVNFSNISIFIYNFSGLKAMWGYSFFISSNDSYFEEQINLIEGTEPIHYIYSENFTLFYNNTNEYYAKTKLPRNLSYYESIYFCNNLENCSAIGACSGAYKDNSSTACYNNTVNNLFIYMPYLGTVFGANDTVAPIITMNFPENNSVINQSYKVKLNISTNEAATCRYSLNLGTYSNINGTTEFNTTFNSYSNSYQNITINCSDSNTNSRKSMIYFRINDTDYPSYDIDIDNTLTELSFEMDSLEPSNISIYLVDNETKKSTSYSLSHEINFTDLEINTAYEYSAKVCDKLRNCDIYNGSARTDSSGSSTTSSSSASGTTGASALGVAKLWVNPEIGEHIMDIPSSEISFTRIIFELNKNITGTVMLTVYKTEEADELPSLENVYQYVRIDEDGITNNDIASAKILFTVPKEWIGANNIIEVNLFRYDGAWEKLEIREIQNDSENMYYEATSEGLSYFAVSGIKGESPSQENPAAVNDATGNAINSPEGEKLERASEREEEEKKKFPFKIISLIIGAIIVIGIIGIFVSSIMQQSKISLSHNTSELKEYIKKSKEQGFNEEQIISHLIASGWDKNIVEPIVKGSPEIKAQEIKELKAYVMVARANGFNDVQIIENLKKAGWNDKQIESAII